MIVNTNRYCPLGCLWDRRDFCMYVYHLANDKLNRALTTTGLLMLLKLLLVAGYSARDLWTMWCFKMQKDAVSLYWWGMWPMFSLIMLHSNIPFSEESQLAVSNWYGAESYCVFVKWRLQPKQKKFSSYTMLVNCQFATTTRISSLFIPLMCHQIFPPVSIEKGCLFPIFSLFY